ncbi:CHAT domain-containing protein, partial [Actinomadura rayongensis]|uniref:CHAT domain-containing protein n=1 Tax=Actinomadura rayongensis TaxID=1429076 RepID=UPI0035E88752
ALVAGGWTTAAAQARVIAARVALHLGRPDAVPPAVPVRAGPAALRAASWHLAALERCGRGDRTGARAAVETGLTILAAHADALAAHEPRALAAGTGADLAALGLELADTPHDLLAAEERRRTLARRPAAVRPPRDPARAAALTEIRTLSARQAAATAETAACPILARRLLRLEATLRMDALRRTPERTPAPPSLHELSAALDGRVLVELVRIGDELHAVTVRDGRARRHVLGPYAAAARETALLRTSVDHADAPPRSLLLTPLRTVLEDRELVLAPTGALHGLPWATLPELAGRPFTVTPSAAAWLRAHRVPRRTGRTVLAAGPGLDHAEDEITRVATAHPGADRLTGPAATAEAVRDALDGAAVAHVAAHGAFRPGNPLFSGLRMADGPLLAHDLEDIAAVPPLIVLSACDAGRSTGGAAMLGLPGVLLALGARTVIAPVTRVADAESAPFMEALYQALATGTPPAHALAEAPVTPGTAGFLCFGAS